LGFVDGPGLQTQPLVPISHTRGDC
jgi:hypothetical protein